MQLYPAPLLFNFWLSCVVWAPIVPLLVLVLLCFSCSATVLVSNCPHCLCWLWWHRWFPCSCVWYMMEVVVLALVSCNILVLVGGGEVVDWERLCSLDEHGYSLGLNSMLSFEVAPGGTGQWWCSLVHMHVFRCLSCGIGRGFELWCCFLLLLLLLSVNWITQRRVVWVGQWVLHG